jgi:hypothetical protein
MLCRCSQCRCAVRKQLLIAGRWEVTGAAGSHADALPNILIALCLVQSLEYAEAFSFSESACPIYWNGDAEEQQWPWRVCVVRARRRGEEGHIYIHIYIVTSDIQFICSNDNHHQLLVTCRYQPASLLVINRD